MRTRFNCHIYESILPCLSKKSIRNLLMVEVNVIALRINSIISRPSVSTGTLPEDIAMLTRFEIIQTYLQPYTTWSYMCVLLWMEAAILERWNIADVAEELAKENTWGLTLGAVFVMGCFWNYLIHPSGRITRSFTV